MPNRPNGDQVVEIPLETLTTFTLDDATPCRYRFLSTPLYIHEKRLSISSFPSLPTAPYTTISYPWRGLQSTTPETSTSSFKIKGMESEPPIPIDILRTICTAALAMGSKWLWLDKLCIRQDGRRSAEGRKDTEWQVQHMYELYNHCAACLVVPGGLSRLANLDETTSWIERAWTLQEALAPPAVEVVFRWEKGDVVLQSNFPVAVRTVVAGKAAVVELKSLLQASLKSPLKLISDPDKEWDWASLPYQNVNIMGRDTDSSRAYPIMALLGAIEHTDDTGRLNAIWRSSVLRSSKYAADMIYSIMGLMGIKLDVDYDKDPTAITIEFTKALTEAGRRADWLGTAPSLGPALRTSAMPIMPFSSDEMGAFIEVAPRRLMEVKKVLEKGGEMLWWWLKDAPRGRVGDDGFLTFAGRAIAVEKSRGGDPKGDVRTRRRDHPGLVVQCSGDSVWKFVVTAMQQHDPPPYFAIVIGRKQWYLSGIFSAMFDNYSTLLMIVSKHKDALAWRNVGYAWADEHVAADWVEREFVVGG